MAGTALCFVDIETTGMRVNADRIIEIGIIRVEDGQEVQRYQALIDPETYLPPFIEQHTGINQRMLESAPTFSQVADEIHSLLSDALFIAHNVRFDYGFLKHEFQRSGLRFSAKNCCTVKLSRALYPQHRRHNLSAIIERFGFACQDRHRALDDADVLWQFYQHAKESFSEELFTAAWDKIQKRVSLPSGLKAHYLDQLPESPGVYIFYDDGQYPLYIGKSIHIKERVHSHFTNDYSSSKQLTMISQIKRIETIQTAGELGALLTESYLVKKEQPLYNRMLREKREVVVARQVDSPDGYLTVRFERISHLEVEEAPSVIRLFTSLRQAKDHLTTVAKEHQLCPKLLGLERGSGGCFASQLKQCHGACIGDELSVKYNLRFQEAFGSRSVKPWPFNGPIIITENNTDNGLTEQFLVDKWCLLRRWQDEQSVELYEPAEYSFDHDTYKILHSYILDPANKKSIRVLSQLPIL